MKNKPDSISKSKNNLQDSGKASSLLRRDSINGHDAMKGARRLFEHTTNIPGGKNFITKYSLLNYNIRDISLNARTGVEAELFFALSKDFKLSVQQLEQMFHISSKTIQNKIEKNIALGPVHSEHLLKLMALYMKGVELFRTVDEFNHWLHKPFWFNNEKPIDWLVTPGGIDAVLDELVKMAYGDAI